MSDERPVAVLTYRLTPEEVLLWTELTDGRRRALRRETTEQGSYYYLPVLLLVGLVGLLAATGIIAPGDLQFALVFGLAGYFIARLCDFGLSKWHRRQLIRQRARRKVFERDYRVSWDEQTMVADMPGLSWKFARQTISHVSDLKGLVLIWMDVLESSLAIPHRAFENEAARRQFIETMALKAP